MKLLAQMGDDESAIEVKRDGRKVVATIDDRVYELEASSPEPNVYLLKHNGRIYEFYLNPATSPGGPQIVSSRDREVEVTFIDPKRLRGSGAGDNSADGHLEIKTMMPGKVVKLIASVGDEVEKGQAVLVVEAMKMQNELKASRAGTIKEIRVQEGSTVGAGDILAVIE